MFFLCLILVLFVLQGVYRNLGRKTFDAMPYHIDEPDEWDGKDDDDHWYTSWRKQVKGWFAFGPLSDYWWARFRNVPKLLFVLCNNKKLLRWEEDGQAASYGSINPCFVYWRCNEQHCYLSRVQYVLDWHLALEWPLFLHGHFGEWQFYIGFKRDGDKIYWLSLYVGKVWK